MGCGAGAGGLGPVVVSGAGRVGRLWLDGELGCGGEVELFEVGSAVAGDLFVACVDADVPVHAVVVGAGQRAVPAVGGEHRVAGGLVFDEDGGASACGVEDFGLCSVAAQGFEFVVVHAGHAVGEQAHCSGLSGVWAGGGSDEAGRWPAPGRGAARRGPLCGPGGVGVLGESGPGPAGFGCGPRCVLCERSEFDCGRCR